jgi:hypothetical protein
MAFRNFLGRAAVGLVEELEKRTRVWLTVVTALYAVLTGSLAAQKLMWNDELYTYYIARLPHRDDIWRTLLTGGEQTPPVFHLTARLMLAAVDPHNQTLVHFAIRLPEIVGFWVACLCLYRFVAKRTTPIYGWIALLFPLVTGAYYYAFEARAYAVVLGFTGIALLCWQAVSENVPRRLALLGLTFSLSAAISYHYYAVLVVFALGIGEAARSVSRRRVDPPVWIALAIGLMLPLTVFFPLIKQSHTYSSIFWSQPQWMQLPAFYIALLTPFLLPLVVAVVLSALPAIRPASASLPTQPDAPGPHSYEIAAAFGFAAIPIMAMIVARTVTHAFTDRYALPAVLGLSLLTAWGARHLWEKRSIPVAALVLLMGLAFVASTRFYRTTILQTSGGSIVSQRDLRRTQQFLLSQCKDPTIPIAVSDTHTFMMLFYYGDPSIVARLVYLADPIDEAHYLGHNSIDQGMLDMVKPWFQAPVQPYASFATSTPRFWLFCAARENSWNWVLPQLLADQRPIAMKAVDAGDLLFLVEGVSERPQIR